MDSPRTYYEFFSGGGMARTGLGPGWRGLFANDFDPLKAAAYRQNFESGVLRVGDVWDLNAADLPGRADLVWASSPCQDLSLAGRREGLSGARSSAFWGFWRLMQGLAQEGRAPGVVVIENVAGLATSNGGADFTALCAALADLDYNFGAVEVDAALFTPQSRPRLFIIARRGEADPALTQEGPSALFHSPRIAKAVSLLPDELKARWLWWRLPPPARRNTDLMSVLEPDEVVTWRSAAETAQLLRDLTPLHRDRLRAAQTGGERRVGALFRRMRMEAGERVQRAEEWFDGLAGCLRTPGGGSSRQFLVVVEGDKVRTRQVSPREGARLMGLPDSYILPPRPTAAFRVIGDGVAVPVVRHLAQHLLEPLTRSSAAPLDSAVG